MSSGQRLAWISPTCALRRKYMQSRDWPMPPPIDSGISPLRSFRCHSSSLRSGQPRISNCRSSASCPPGCPSKTTRRPFEDRVPNEDVAVQSLEARRRRRWTSRRNPARGRRGSCRPPELAADADDEGRTAFPQQLASPAPSASCSGYRASSSSAWMKVISSGNSGWMSG